MALPTPAAPHGIKPTPKGRLRLPAEPHGFSRGSSQPFGDNLTDENLRLLSDIIHEYKDSNRGWKERLLEVMALELKLLIGTDGRYEPDTTYNVKDKVYSPDDIDLNQSRFKNLLDSSVPEKSRRAFLEVVADLATQSQTEPEEVMYLLAKNPECIFTRLATGYLYED